MKPENCDSAAGGPGAPQPDIRVLMSFARPDESSNPFVKNLAAGVGRYSRVTYLHPRTIVFGKFNILHVHWPENLFVGGTRLRSIIKSALGLWLLARTVIQRVPIVVTVHNLEPHEEHSRFHRRLYKWIDEHAVARIYLNESSENNPARGVTILHGDYPIGAITSSVRRRATPDGRVALLYGQLRRYKGIESLIVAFREIEDPGVSLRIIGAAADSQYLAELRDLVDGDTRISLLPGFVSETDLEAELAECALVVLPYKRIYNSGAALLALSRGKRILVPTGPSTLSLRDEIGADAVRLFDDALSSEALYASLQYDSTHHRADLSRRNWAKISELHHELYSLVLRSQTVRTGADWRGRKTRVSVAHSRKFIEHSLRNALVTNWDGSE